MLSRKAKERGIDLSVRDAQKYIKQGVIQKLSKVAPEMEVAPAQTKGEKAVDIAAGITTFAAELYALKKVFPVGTSEKAIWEAQNLLTGGTPGAGGNTKPSSVTLI